MQIWAVDVSGYHLWTSKSKGEPIIEKCLGDQRDEQDKVKRYVREIDQIRCLAGKVLIRLAVLSQRKDLSNEDLFFHRTKEGKPFLSSPILDLDYNITHDGDWVAIAFEGSMQSEERQRHPHIGVDVMEIHLPHYEKSVDDFVETMDASLTTRERDWILHETEKGKDTLELIVDHPSKSRNLQYDQLKRLYTLWTYKEAYTKARGIGLGYDFQKIDVCIDKGKCDLEVEGKRLRQARILQITLPCGESKSNRIGAGTGMESLIVAMQLQVDSITTELISLTAKEAQEKSLLRMWSMEELVESLSDIISEKT